MAGDRIDFSRNGKKIYLDDGKSFKKANKELKTLKPIFEEIDKVGNKRGKVDGKESELLQLLREKLGKYISEDAMTKLVEDFKKSGLTIEEFLKKEVVEPVKVKEPEPVVTPAPVVEPEDEVDSDAIADTIVKTLQTQAEEEAKVKKDVIAEDKKSSRKAFNDMIQNLKMKIANDEEKLKSEYGKTYTIQKGDSFYKIAERSLKEENGGKKPTPLEVNKRIAEIALVNGINDVYKTIHAGETIKIKGAETVAPNPPAEETQGAPVEETQSAPVESQDGSTTAVNPNPPVEETQSAPVEETQGETTVAVKPEGEPVVPQGQEPVVSEIEKSFEVVEGQIDDTWSSEEILEDDGFRYWKYTKTEGEGENAVTKTRFNCKCGTFYDCFIEAETLEELKELKKSFYKKIKAAPEGETAEAAATRKAENLTTLKERVEAYPSVDVLKDVISGLRRDEYTDKTSDEFKAFVKSLLLTKNADAISSLVADNMLFEKDKEALETAAALYKEIVDKEKAGVKLTDDEHSLKEVLSDNMEGLSYSIPADTEKGVVAKKERFISSGIIYEAEHVLTSTPELLDEFVTKTHTANTPEKRAALFREYVNTDDVQLAKTLAFNAKNFNVTKDDVLALVNKNGMAVIDHLSRYNPKAEDKDSFNDAVKNRVVDIYLGEDKGNIENLKYLGTAFDKIDATKMTNEEKVALKTQIIESYFVVETSKDEEGNDVKTYKFEPLRRYTKNEMDKWVQYCNGDMQKAIADSIKLEDMGLNEYTSAVEENVASEVLVPKFAEFVDKMETKEEVLDFIGNKVRYSSDVPFDKIMEKFPDDPDIIRNLVAVFDSYCVISDENKIKLAKFFTQTDENGNVTFDRSKRPAGTSMRDFVDLLPEDCKEGEAAKIANAVINTLGKDELSELAGMAPKAPDAVRAKLGELVAANKDDGSYIYSILEKFDESVLPHDVLMNLNVAELEYDDGTKQLLFEKCYKGRIERTDWDKALAKGVELGLLNKVIDNRYQIGDVLYCTDWHYPGADGENGTDDDTLSMHKVSSAGYSNGIKMFEQLKGAGSGDIAAMLRGTEVPYYNYVNKNNITGILTGFTDSYKKEGIMEYIANEWGLSPGVKPGKALCNRIPKALMRKAAELELTDTDEYKALKTYFGADDNFKFTKNDEAGVRYSPADARALDAMISALYKVVLQNS